MTADDGELGEQYLRDFQDNEKTIPTILTTSQKLSTGVDARNIRNIVLMRPINSMIEFKQIIGRGTRLYDGKDYFTDLRLRKSAPAFSRPGVGRRTDRTNTTNGKRKRRNRRRETEEKDGEAPPRPKIKIKLADGKERDIQHMTATTYWHADGTPVSAQQFMEILFGKLPEFFKSEAELRALWSQPETRARLLQGLADKGFGKEQLTEMQQIIDAEKSDLFDVLAHVAYSLPPITREDRANRAKLPLRATHNSPISSRRFLISCWLNI